MELTSQQEALCEAIASGLDLKAACLSLCINRSTIYYQLKWQGTFVRALAEARRASLVKHHRAMNELERQVQRNRTVKGATRRRDRNLQNKLRWRTMRLEQAIARATRLEALPRYPPL